MKLRETWGSKLGFLMATAGSAIGLGSLWKFPYATGENGGGLFVLTYLVFTFLIGIPIFLGELAIGRRSQSCPVGAFTKLAPRGQSWSQLGWFTTFLGFLILSFYNVVAGWSLNYILTSLVNAFKGKTSAQIDQVFRTLESSGDINILWSTLFLVLTAAIVYKGIRHGIEFWSKILTPALLVFLILLFIYSCTLDGFGEAFRFIFYPNLAKITPSGILQGLGMACFTLSIGMGILITYGSYMHSEDDIPQTGFIIATMNVFVSLIAALTIFPIIFTFGFSPQEGPGLLFKILPFLFTQLPGGTILSTIFFILVLFAALTSTISVFEVLIATLIERFNWSRGKACFIASLGLFLVGLPSALSDTNTLFKSWKAIFGMNFFDTLNYLCFTWFLPLSALLTSIFMGWVTDKNTMRQEFIQGSRLKYLYYPWKLIIRYIVPVAIVLIILDEGGIIQFNKLFF